MREKFKKVEKGNGNLDLKDFGYEVIDERFVPNQEAYLGDQEEAEEEMSEGGESEPEFEIED